jgi:hypothetical protein
MQCFPMWLLNFVNNVLENCYLHNLSYPNLSKLNVAGWLQPSLIETIKLNSGISQSICAATEPLGYSQLLIYLLMIMILITTYDLAF